MNNHCIYRNINDCKCCFFKTKNKYCNLHINNANLIYEIINHAIGIRQIKTTNDIYLIFKYIYDTPTIYVKEGIFKKILTSLFIKQWMLKAKYNYIKIENYELFINEIFKLNLNTYKIEKNNDLSFLIKIKKFMNYISICNHIYKSNITYTNETDPFTFDKFEEIPFKERFIFCEDNNYYCFKANDFKYFIRTNGCWNPYTKKIIEPKIINNLEIFIDYFKINKNNNNSWKTLEQAFTDVSLIIQKVGFYTNMQWFLKLSKIQIRNIIRLFRVISLRNNNNNHEEYFRDLLLLIFDNDNDNNEDEIYYSFARNIIKIFENGDSNFLLCCNFMKSVGVYSNDFYNSLPEWLSDIESPIIINSNSLTQNLVYLINIIEN